MKNLIIIFLFALLSCDNSLEIEKISEKKQDNKTTTKSNLNLEGWYSIANPIHNQMFVAYSDKIGNDYKMECRPSVTAIEMTYYKFQKKIKKLDNGYYQIHNRDGKYLYASRTNVSNNNDHYVQASDHSSLESNYQWEVVPMYGFYYLKNKDYGYIFSANDIKIGDDHILLARPENNMSQGDYNIANFKWSIYMYYFYPRWMSDLDGNKLISQYSIPGTHESCALHGNIFAECQDYILWNQLLAGIRFFDLRLRNIDGAFMLYHGVIYQEISFARVLEIFYEYLRQCPNETILVSIKKEGDNVSSNIEFGTLLKQYIANDPQKWYTDNRIPTLNEARSKIVLLRRYSENNNPIGINCRNGWGNNTTSLMTIPNGYIKVQDHYDIDTDDYYDKWVLVNNFLNEARYNNQENILYINFTSAVGGFFIFPNPKEISSKINPILHHFMLGQKGRFGIVATDFQVPNINRLIIESNNY